MTLTYLTGRRNAQNTPWTGERDALLTRLWAEGYSASQIACQIDDRMSRCAVLGRVHRLQLPARAPRQPAKRKPYKRRMFVPKPPPPAPRPRPSRSPPSKIRPLTLFELEPTSCRWPIGDGPFLFCGAEAASGEVYCPFHRRMARVRGKDG